jgi:signal transduction histidine kinase
MQKNLNKTIGYWNLRKKILVSMISLLLLLGLTSALITRTALLSVLRLEFRQKGINSARSLVANSIVDVLTQNTSRLKQLIVNEKNLDRDIAYVFIIDSSNRIIAHTFNEGFPVDLVKANNPKPDKPFNSQLLDTQMGVIYDIAVPVLSGKSVLAYVRLGLLQNNIQKTINKISMAFFGIALFIIIIAVFLAYKVSSLITKPISKLVEAAEAIQKGDFSTRLNIKVKDEIGLLSSAFNEMTSQLKQMVDKIKHLSLFEERNRIAIDLHDCCAQDLANIIKRLELCEKLFQKEPALAIKELQDLKENTRNLLNRTREVIFELKSPEDAGFDLLSKLTSYIEDYKKITDIAVKLEMQATINNTPPLKAKEIFYIIAEALTNVKRHSQAKNVRITLKSNGNNNLMVDIVDDGKGFETSDTKLFSASSGGWGIIGMRQRAASLGGELVIDSSSENGTRVSVNIPLVN